jgi:hypothetical protein
MATFSNHPSYVPPKCQDCEHLRVWDGTRKELTCDKLNIYVDEKFYCADYEARKEEQHGTRL